jgi:serine/threonine-protein kinase HipA
MTEPRLTLWQHGIPVADLHWRQGALTWTYRPDWRLSGWALSPHLPLDAPHADAAAERFVRHLLPHAADDASLLQALGHDLPGALQVTSGDLPTSGARLRLINEASLVQRLDEGADLSVWNDRCRLSVPGGGRKLTVFLGSDGTLYWPDGPYPSTHVIHFAPLDEPDRVLRQWLAGQLSQAVGVLAVSGTLRRFGDHLGWVVPRFDRRVVQRKTGAWAVERLALLNGAQALDLPVTDAVDLSLPDLMAFGDQCTLPIMVRKHSVDWALFRLIIGDVIGDGLKDANRLPARSVNGFHDAGGLALAPFCGLVAARQAALEDMDTAYDHLVSSLTRGPVAIKPSLIANHMAQLAARCERALDQLDASLPPELAATQAAIRQRCRHLGG